MVKERSQSNIQVMSGTAEAFSGWRHRRPSEQEAQSISARPKQCGSPRHRRNASHEEKRNPPSGRSRLDLAWAARCDIESGDKDKHNSKNNYVVGAIWGGTPSNRLQRQGSRGRASLHHKAKKTCQNSTCTVQSRSSVRNTERVHLVEMLSSPSTLHP